MSDYEYAGGNTNTGFMTQDLIRTVNLSFQPYLPFTQQYSMMLQEANDPQRANYFRLGPPTPAEDYKDTSAADSSYPFSMRRDLFGGQTGQASGRLTAVAKNKDREQQIFSKLPPMENKVAPLAEQLSTLLNASYAFDSRSFIDRNFTRESSRDANELETKMFSEMLDDAMQVTSSDPDQQRKDLVFTDQTGKGFDILINRYRGMQEYVKSLGFASNIQGLEVSRGVQEKSFFKIGETRGLTEGTIVNKIITQTNKVISQYNNKIQQAIGPHLREAKAVNPAVVTPFKTLPPYILAEVAREAGATGKGRGSSDFMIRQIMDRFARNFFQPYLFQGQVSEESSVIIQLAPFMKGDVPQIESISKEHVRFFKTNSTFIQGMANFAVREGHLTPIQAESMVTSARRKAANRSIATLATLESTGRYTLAAASMNGNNIDVTLGTEKGASVHKMSIDISNKLLKDIKAYYSSTQMTAAFKKFYEDMMRTANKLSHSWYRGSSKVVGMRGKPISEEWRAMSGWEKGDDFKKKYIGVWSSDNEQVWKDGTGRNFSIAPFLESRRQYAGGRASSQFTLQ